MGQGTSLHTGMQMLWDNMTTVSVLQNAPKFMPDTESKPCPSPNLTYLKASGTRPWKLNGMPNNGKTPPYLQNRPQV
jgi:hypothetical protein